MARDFSNLEVTRLNAFPSMGHLLGTTAPTSLVSRLNDSGDKYGYYGSVNDRFNDRRELFINRLVKPLQSAGRSISETIRTFHIPSEITRFESDDDLRNIHPRMYMPILTHDPVFKLLKEEKISGFDMDISDVEKEKPTYDRLLEQNGFIDYLDEQNTAGYKFITWEHYSDDPVFDEDEIEILQDNREYIEDFLKRSSLDPTDLDSIRG